jgi:hypothetical protein
MHFYLQIVYVVDNSLKDNILYESAGPDFERMPTCNGDEYAVIFYLSSYGNVDSYFISNIDTARMEDRNNANAGGVLFYSWYSHHSNIEFIVVVYAFVFQLLIINRLLARKVESVD